VYVERGRGVKASEWEEGWVEERGGEPAFVVIGRRKGRGGVSLRVRGVGCVGV